ncbi:peptide chain release factor N(5)-glutamine methyltransferase [Rugamonas sp.]|uniref:peptide chain release factor N(5)-glutamine methyltransferase n=1 Tax=Rugamonas sp. TaxID=1926287 RepID=UPI0025DF3755|nr:peptide chain release factor N(5)-glutamine methyltransferase [Rugamonas sp.]
MNASDPRIVAGVTLGALQIGAPLDAVDHRILLCHALGLTRVGLITQSERMLTADEAQRLSALVARRLGGEPVAYIIGRREFFGLPFEVTPAVLIPRPDTELLVELALERLPPAGRVLDMGTGSGAIAVALAHTRPDARVTALDVSEAALAVAARNAAANGARVRLLRSDWYAALDSADADNAAAGTDATFDLIVSNPPYIASGDRHLSEGDLRFEPAGALTDHADGLSALRRIVAGAASHLAPQGWLLMEHGYDQAAAVRALLSAQGYGDVQSWRDLSGIERVSGGRAR